MNSLFLRVLLLLLLLLLLLGGGGLVLFGVWWLGFSICKKAFSTAGRARFGV